MRFLDWCKSDGKRLSREVKFAAMFLEKNGKEPWVHFGYGNAITEARRFGQKWYYFRRCMFKKFKGKSVKL